MEVQAKSKLNRIKSIIWKAIQDPYISEKYLRFYNDEEKRYCKFYLLIYYLLYTIYSKKTLKIIGLLNNINA